MSHDERQSDIWYHDSIMPNCVIDNYLALLIDYREQLSKEEIDITLVKMMEQNKKAKNILYEEYLEKRRVENGLQNSSKK